MFFPINQYKASIYPQLFWSLIKRGLMLGDLIKTTKKASIKN